MSTKYMNIFDGTEGFNTGRDLFDYLEDAIDAGESYDSYVRTSRVELDEAEGHRRHANVYRKADGSIKLGKTVFKTEWKAEAAGSKSSNYVKTVKLVIPGEVEALVL